MPEVTREVTIKKKIRCPYCKKEHEVEITEEVTLEFDMSDYAPDYDWRD